MVIPREARGVKRKPFDIVDFRVAQCGYPSRKHRSGYFFRRVTNHLRNLRITTSLPAAISPLPDFYRSSALSYPHPFADDNIAVHSRTIRQPDGGQWINQSIVDQSQLLRQLGDIYAATLNAQKYGLKISAG